MVFLVSDTRSHLLVAEVLMEGVDSAALDSYSHQSLAMEVRAGTALAEL